MDRVAVLITGVPADDAVGAVAERQRAHEAACEVEEADLARARGGGRASLPEQFDKE